MWRFLKEVTKHTSIYGMGGMATKVIGFFLLPLYTHYLTPADYGVLGLLYITMRVLDIVVIQGLTTSIFRAYSFDYKGDPANQADAVCTAYYYSIGSALVFFGVSRRCFAGPLNDLVFKDANWTHLFRMMFLAGIFRATQNIPRQIMRAHRKSVAYSAIQLVDMVAAALLNIWFIVGDEAGPRRDRLQRGHPRRRADDRVLLPGAALSGASASRKAKLHDMLAFGLPKIPGGLSFLMLSASDRYFLEHYSTPTELGLYSVGYRLATLLSDFAIQPFIQTWPTMYFPLAQGFARTRARPSWGASSPTSVVRSGSWGSRSASSSSRSCTSWRTQVPAARTGRAAGGRGAGLLRAVPRHHGRREHQEEEHTGCRSWWRARPSINIIFNFLLIPRWGMMGAAWATVIAYVCMCTASYIVDEYYFPIRYEWGRILRIVRRAWASPTRSPSDATPDEPHRPDRLRRGDAAAVPRAAGCLRVLQRGRTGDAAPARQPRPAVAACAARTRFASAGGRSAGRRPGRGAGAVPPRPSPWVPVPARDREPPVARTRPLPGPARARVSRGVTLRLRPRTDQCRSRNTVRSRHRCPKKDSPDESAAAVVTAGLGLALAGPAAAQDADSVRRSYTTQRAADAPRMDGVLDDPCWQAVEWSSEFVQREPTEGAPPTRPDRSSRSSTTTTRSTSPSAPSTNRRRSPGYWRAATASPATGSRSTSTATPTSAPRSRSRSSLSGHARRRVHLARRQQLGRQLGPDLAGATARRRRGLDRGDAHPAQSSCASAASRSKTWGLQVQRRIFRKEERSIWQPISEGRVPAG